MQPFSLLIKPASAACNLACRYCFYSGKSALYPEVETARMDERTLEVLIRRYMETRQPVYSMIWQGGEPVLMGAAFFKRVIALQKQHAPSGAYLANSLQTNATLVSPDFAQLLHHYRFLVGCSIDGPPELHDIYRVDASGVGSHTRVLRGMRILREQQVAVSALVLVSAANVASPLKVYHYLLSQGWDNLQFIPCVESDVNGNPLPFSITGEQWGAFLLAVFNEWYGRGQWNVTIRNFESIAAQLMRAKPTECRLCESCDQYFVVEHNGDIYPCDFFVEDRYRIGNIHDISFQEARNSDVYRKFTNRKKQLPQECAQCEHFDLCLGDCLHYRPADNWMKQSLLCEGWKLFFGASKAKFVRLIRMLSA